MDNGAKHERARPFRSDFTSCSSIEAPAFYASALPLRHRGAQRALNGRRGDRASSAGSSTHVGSGRGP
eukprot:11599344-Alexandrium_andersonii.AAC.1